FGVLSEESGRHHADRAVTVVVDPLDGSTNASRGIPWFATSLCAVDDEGPLAALVVNLVDGTTYRAERGQGATVDGRVIAPSTSSTTTPVAHPSRPRPPRCSPRSWRHGAPSRDPYAEEVLTRLHLLLLRIYRRLPTSARRVVVRRLAPQFTVGALCVIERP